jgi:hypothetical protein
MQGTDVPRSPDRRLFAGGDFGRYHGGTHELVTTAHQFGITAWQGSSAG